MGVGVGAVEVAVGIGEGGGVAMGTAGAQAARPRDAINTRGNKISTEKTLPIIISLIFPSVAEFPLPAFYLRRLELSHWLVGGY